MKVRVVLSERRECTYTYTQNNVSINLYYAYKWRLHGRTFCVGMNKHSANWCGMAMRSGLRRIIMIMALNECRCRRHRRRVGGFIQGEICRRLRGTSRDFNVIACTR